MEVIKARKFGPKWTGWIENWLKLSKTHIVLNGQVGNEIAYRRSLRQRDLLSPLLFTLVIDGLNAIIEKEKEAEWIRELPTLKKPLITNIQYTDNTIIFR